MPETEVKARTEGYRIWLTADTVEQIRGLAEKLHIDHKRLMAVWTVEMLAQKEQQLRMAEIIANKTAEVMSEAVGVEMAALEQLLEEKTED